MITLESRFKLADDVTYQSLGEDQETVVLSLASGYLYTCNDTAAAVMDLLDGSRCLSQVADEMSRQYEVQAEQLHRDVVSITEQLSSEGLIVPA